jgi:hypothetical protein
MKQTKNKIIDMKYEDQVKLILDTGNEFMKIVKNLENKYISSNRASTFFTTQYSVFKEYYKSVCTLQRGFNHEESMLKTFIQKYNNNKGFESLREDQREFLLKLRLTNFTKKFLELHNSIQLGIDYVERLDYILET